MRSLFTSVPPGYPVTAAFGDAPEDTPLQAPSSWLKYLGVNAAGRGAEPLTAAHRAAAPGRPGLPGRNTSPADRGADT
ncbi:hypothetical protein CDO87_05395 [Sagittula sp. P11]|uniref:hypothetical protein n=1 Tax=Sagittula sp. P11 TaxID=2009329 RepID=UPI000C2D3230|nr:hypothetical protein [Sagittula sp. P11]AUC52659.1 hypothetical protein CDO87_05395 [Sagittula sp. P11]